MLDAALRCQRVSFAFSSLLSVLSASVDFVTAGTSILLEEFALDRNPARFGLLVTLPIIFCISVVGHTFPFMTPNPLIFFISSFAYSSSEICRSCEIVSCTSQINS